MGNNVNDDQTQELIQEGCYLRHELNCFDRVMLSIYGFVMFLFTLFISFLTFFTVQASETQIQERVEEEKEASTATSSAIGLQSTSGSDYLSEDLSVEHEFGEHWDAGVGLNGARFGQGTRTREIRVEGEYEVDPTLSFGSIVRKRREPNDIRAAAFGVETQWLMSKLWQDSMDNTGTRIRINAEWTKFSQTEDLNRPAEENLESSVLQQRFALGLLQDISSRWVVGATFSSFRYGDRGKTRRLRRATNRRPSTSVDSDLSWVQGFPDRAASLSASYSASDHVDLGMVVGESKTVVEDVTSRFAEVSVDWSINLHWSTSVALIGSRASSGNQVNLVNLGASYRW